MNTTRQILAVRQYGGTLAQGGPPELSAGVQIIEELVALGRVAKRDMMTVRRHDRHRHLSFYSELYAGGCIALITVGRFNGVL